MSPGMPVLIIAHRACPQHAPENSIAGIRRAAELGAGGVEVDVQRTLDGVPILMHDWTLGRPVGLPPPTRLLPYALVRRLRLKGGAERVPSLAVALDALPDGLLIALEIKHPSATAGRPPPPRRLRVYSRSPDVESTVANVACGLDGAITDWPAEVRAALSRGRAEGRAAGPLYTPAPAACLFVGG